MKGWVGRRSDGSGGGRCNVPWPRWHRHYDRGRGHGTLRGGGDGDVRGVGRSPCHRGAACCQCCCRSMVPTVCCLVAAGRGRAVHLRRDRSRAVRERGREKSHGVSQRRGWWIEAVADQGGCFLVRSLGNARGGREPKAGGGRGDRSARTDKTKEALLSPPFFEYSRPAGARGQAQAMLAVLCSARMPFARRDKGRSSEKQAVFFLSLSSWFRFFCAARVIRL